jgi:hypothetical protein
MSGYLRRLLAWRFLGSFAFAREARFLRALVRDPRIDIARLISFFSVMIFR